MPFVNSVRFLASMNIYSLCVYFFVFAPRSFIRRTFCLWYEILKFINLALVSGCWNNFVRVSIFFIVFSLLFCFHVYISFVALLPIFFDFFPKVLGLRAMCSQLYYTKLYSICRMHMLKFIENHICIESWIVFLRLWFHHYYY